MNGMHGSPRKPAKKLAQIALVQTAFLLSATIAVVGCANVVTGDGSGGPGGAGGTGSETGSTTTGSTTTGGVDDAGTTDSNVATSQANPPWGVWSMIVQYGPPGGVTTPTIPMQVELRSDGTAFAWICAGAPDDGSFSQSCATIARTQCWIGTVAWNGKRWRVDFPVAHVGGVPNQGDITPDGKGNILIAYINPTYSGALFKKVGAAMSGADACVP
jgi:hypothetical protein